MEITVLNQGYSGTNWLLTQRMWADPRGMAGALKGYQPGHARTPLRKVLAMETPLQ